VDGLCESVHKGSAQVDSAQGDGSIVFRPSTQGDGSLVFRPSTQGDGSLVFRPE